MAFGGLKGTLTGNGASVGTSNALTGSVAVAVGDLVFVAFGQQTNLTATGASSSLVTTYTAQNAGTDAGTSTGRAFWGIVTTAGTLTQVNVAASSSTNDWCGLAAVIEGPFEASSAIDANPANITSDVTSPLTCPATGTLGRAWEAVICWGAAPQSTVWAATSPNLLAGNANNSTNIKVAIGYQAVTATTSVQPVFTVAANPADCTLGTCSFKGKFIGAIAQTLLVTRQSATGTERFTGSAASVLGHATQSATGNMKPVGMIDQTLTHVSQEASGAERFAGTIVQLLAPTVQIASGAERLAGMASSNLSHVLQEATGNVAESGTTGTIVQMAARAGQELSGSERFIGTISSAAAHAIQQASAVERLTGSAASVAAHAVQFGSAAERVAGLIAQALSAASQSAGGGSFGGMFGTAASVLSSLMQAAIGLVTNSAVQLATAGRPPADSGVAASRFNMSVSERPASRQNSQAIRSNMPGRSRRR